MGAPADPPPPPPPCSAPRSHTHLLQLFHNHVGVAVQLATAYKADAGAADHNGATAEAFCTEDTWAKFSEGVAAAEGAKAGGNGGKGKGKSK